MMQVLSQLLSAALGSVGFGLIFNLNRRYLPAAAVGGFLAWLAYLLADHALSSAFLANLLAGFCAAFYAEILARCCNAPSTPFMQNGARQRSIQKTSTAMTPASRPSHRLPPKNTAKLEAASTLPASRSRKSARLARMASSCL